MKLFVDKQTSSFTIGYAFIVLIYFGLSLFGVLHHEVWLDEAHHWLLARDSSTIKELIFNARYDGHPLLWNILLFIITRFTHEVFFMQLLNIIFSSIAIIIFLKKAPFNYLFKFLFVFGYFIFYEYNIISRNYSISFLFLMISVSLICERQKIYPLIFISLLVLANTHLFSLFCSVSLFIAIVILFFKEQHSEKEKIKFIAGSFLFIILIAVVLWSIIPPPGHFLEQKYVDSYLSFKRIGKGFSIYFKGFFHMPNFFKYNFWNTNLWVDASKNVTAGLSIVCFVIPFIILYNKPISIFVFYFSTLSIALFIFWSPIVPGVRYFGYVWIMFVVALWMRELSVSQKFKFSDSLDKKLKSISEYVKLPFIYSILAMQVISAFTAYAIDVKRPFSESKNVVNYLAQNDWSSKMIVLSNQCAGCSVSAYLNKKLFYPETNGWGSFCKWNTNPMVIDKDALVSRLGSINSKSFLFIRNGPWIYPDTQIPGMNVFEDKKMKMYFLTKFDKGTMKGENYWLYKVEKMQ